MSKKIAVINDLSGFGRCSLTAAISVISAMGVQACPLPTAILTAQTEYPSFYCDDLTDKMKYFQSEWKKMNQHFDVIYTGFVASEAQIGEIQKFINAFHKPDTKLLVDPVMGDDGFTYSTFTPELLREMRKLAMRADIITPNVTELCLLTDTTYDELQAYDSYHQMLARITELGRSLCENGPSHIIVTGIQFTDEANVPQVGNLYISKDSDSLLAFPYVGGHYSGTGDLFASCLAAGIARGDEIPSIIKLAGTFLEQALTDSVAENVPRNDGVNFEKFLKLLIS